MSDTPDMLSPAPPRAGSSPPGEPVGTSRSDAGDRAAPNPRPRNRLSWLEAGRGIAALLVVLHHAGSILAEPRFFGRNAFHSHLGNFNVGIDFFFVLSGFIITWAHWRDIGQPAKVGGFLKKRFVRIYPIYWIILLPLCAAYLATPGSGRGSQHDLGNVLLSFTLLPNPQQPILGVAWTLTYEVFFYALFVAVIAFGRRSLPLLMLWPVAIVAAGLAGPRPFPTSFLLSPFDLEFVAGAAAAWLLRTRSLPFPRLLMAAGAAIFILSMLFWSTSQDDPLVGRLVYGGGALLFVLGSVQLEERRPAALPRLAMLLGAASYSIYLVHPLALSIGSQLIRHSLGHRISAEVAVLILAPFACCAGVLFHFLVETPLTGWLRRRLLGGTPPKAGAGEA